MAPRNSFTRAIRAKAQPIWDRELKHPFVRGLADGTLSFERFRFYLAQDYLFLIEYSRVFALAAAKARDLQTIGLFTRLLDETLNTEMQLHCDYCRRLGITESDLERIAPAPVTHGYTRHLLTVAYGGSIADIVAAMLPCQLGYAEIATTLAGESRSGANPKYAEWIKTYSSREFISGAEKLGSLPRRSHRWMARARAGVFGVALSDQQPLRISVLGNGLEPILLAPVKTDSGRRWLCRPESVSRNCHSDFGSKESRWRKFNSR
jgi:thiaminase (transcriptional activator TenA)